MGQDETNQNKKKYSIGFDIIPLLYNTKCLPNKLLKEDYVPYNLTLTIPSKNNYSYRIGANLFYYDSLGTSKTNYTDGDYVYYNTNTKNKNFIVGLYVGVQKKYMIYNNLHVTCGIDFGYLYNSKEMIYTEDLKFISDGHLQWSETIDTKYANNIYTYPFIGLSYTYSPIIFSAEIGPKYCYEFRNESNIFNSQSQNINLLFSFNLKFIL
ncbi:hypothetical protein FACS1894153_1060 [Bacteroidia bacterium]|nr:hypothetical protein FACS1894153_1060 [Bacteroidia bacterium]